MKRITAAVALLLTATACSSSGSEADVTRIVPKAAIYQPVGVGSTYLASDAAFGARRIVRSDDGVHWSRVQLPDAPAPLGPSPASPRQAGDFVVVAAKPGPVGSPTNPLPTPTYLWATADGRTWFGGRIAAPNLGGAPTVQAAGDVVLAGTSIEDRFLMWMLRDREWRPVDVRGVDLVGRGTATLANLWETDDGLRATVVPEYDGTGRARTLVRL